VVDVRRRQAGGGCEGRGGDEATRGGGDEGQKLSRKAHGPAGGPTHATPEARTHARRQWKPPRRSTKLPFRAEVQQPSKPSAAQCMERSAAPECSPARRPGSSGRPATTVAFPSPDSRYRIRYCTSYFRPYRGTKCLSSQHQQMIFISDFHLIDRSVICPIPRLCREIDRFSR